MFFARLYGMSKIAARRRIEELLKISRLRICQSSLRRAFDWQQAAWLLHSRCLLLLGFLLLDEPTRSLDPLAAGVYARPYKSARTRRAARLHSAHFTAT